MKNRYAHRWNGACRAAITLTGRTYESYDNSISTKKLNVTTFTIEYGLGVRGTETWLMHYSACGGFQRVTSGTSTS